MAVAVWSLMTVKVRWHWSADGICSISAWTRGWSRRCNEYDSVCGRKHTPSQGYLSSREFWDYFLNNTFFWLYLKQQACCNSPWMLQGPFSAWALQNMLAPDQKNMWQDSVLASWEKGKILDCTQIRLQHDKSKSSTYVNTLLWAANVMSDHR